MKAQMMTTKSLNIPGPFTTTSISGEGEGKRTQEEGFEDGSRGLWQEGLEGRWR